MLSLAGLVLAVPGGQTDRVLTVDTPNIKEREFHQVHGTGSVAGSRVA